MWFNNIRLYCLTKPLELSPDEIAEKLAQHKFRPCNNMDKSTFGWVSPLGRQGELLTHVIGDYMMICGQKQEKILPASVVNEVLEEKVEDLEARQGRKIYRKEKLQLKEDIFISLLPRAFTRTSTTFAYFSFKENLLVVNASSANKAEELLSFLRNSIDSLPVMLPNSISAPSDVMTRWLKQQVADKHFDIDQECELYNPVENSNVIRCKGQDLYTDEIQSHLDAGKQVKKLGVVWKEVLSCIIEDDLSIKRIKFLDMVLDKVDSGNIEDAAEQFDQDFAVMTLELSDFFKSFFSAFGGLQVKE